MQNFTTKTVREIALETPATTRVFEEFKIDYCCGGRKSLTAACESAGANPEVVMEKLDQVMKAGGHDELEFLKNATLGRLIDHIEQKHHSYTKYEVTHLPDLMQKVARVHGENHPELLDLKDLFKGLCDDLAPHMMKEEVVLFPYIRELELKRSEGASVSPPPFGTVGNPIRMMMAEHDTAGELLRGMRELADDYTLPEGACPSFSGLYHRFGEFERDLHQHIHLENNLLFPRAIELEEEMFQTMAA